MKNSRPEEGVYGGTWFHSPLRAAQRGPRWNRLWPLHFWSSRRLARHWPRWQIARGLLCGAELHFRRNAAIWGPRKIEDFVGCTAALGPSGPRRECGVRRRKPVCRATGVYQIKGAPAKSKILWAAQQPSALLGRAASAAFDGGSPCVGRPESIKSKGSPQNRRFCGAKKQKKTARCAAFSGAGA